MDDFGTIAGNTLTFVRLLPGPIERVWTYLTQAALLAEWFSSGVVAARVGGAVEFEIGATGRVTAYEPPRLLEYTWNEAMSSSGPVFDSLVRWELSEDGDKVRLTLTHTRLPDDELVAHGAGWHTFAERLRACLEGREPVPVRPRFERLKVEYAKLRRMNDVV